MKTIIWVLLLIITATMIGDAITGCGKWVIRDNTDYLEDPAFDALTENAKTEPQAAATAAPAPAAAPAAAPAVPEPEAPDLSGMWSVRFESANSSLSLNLIQTDRNGIMGTGDYVENGKKIPVTAKGGLKKDALNLDVKLVVNEYVNTLKREYKMSLLYANETLSGAYELYENSDLLAQGNATALRARA